MSYDNPVGKTEWLMIRAPDATRRQLFGNPSFAMYWTARFFAVLGSQITYVSFPLLALAISASAFEASLVTVATYVTPVLAAVPAGYLADRFSRKALMVSADIANAASYSTIGWLVFVDEIGVPTLIVGAIAVSGASSVYNAAATAALPSLVGTHALKIAVSTNETRDFLLALAGPVIGSALFVQNWWAPFLVNAAAFFLSACVTSGIRRSVTGKVAVSRGGLVSQSVAGLRVASRDRALVSALGLLASLSFVLTLNFFSIVNLFSQRGSELDAGALVATQALGGFIGALLAVRITRCFGPRLVFLIQGMLWIQSTLATALFGNVWLTGPALALTWVMTPAMRVVYQSHVARTVPEYLRGRVAGTAQLVTSVVSPIGVLVAGLLATRWSPFVPFWVGAAVALVGTTAFFMATRRGHVAWADHS
jgi:MFS family permease